MSDKSKGAKGALKQIRRGGPWGAHGDGLSGGLVRALDTGPRKNSGKKNYFETEDIATRTIVKKTGSYLGGERI